jgi:glycopeptide antibiotics resistance protein
MFRQHPLLSVATLAYLGVVGWLTLSPSVNSPEASWLWWLYTTIERWGPTSWVTFLGVEFVANILMFLPVGVFFVLLLGRSRWWAAIIFGVIGSCWIELAQYLWLPDRTADVRDVLSNGIGVIIGVGVAELLTWPVLHRRRAIIDGRQATRAVPAR